MSITAMRQALEAMEYADACLKKQLTTKAKHEYAQDLLMEAGTALRQALEQSDEPVAWGFQNTAITGSNRWMMLREKVPANDQYGGALWTPLYTRPQPADEPVIDNSAAIRIATALGWEPKREPLTDEQIEDGWEKITGHSIFGGNRTEGRTMYLSPDEVIEFARAIEAAHGIKENT